MSKHLLFLLLGVAFVFLQVGCQQKGKDAAQLMENSQSVAKAETGVVQQIMEAPGYTYALVKAGDEELWLAGPLTKINVGDVVPVTREMPMRNFHSKAFSRDFDVLYFVASFCQSSQEARDPHGGMDMKPLAIEVAKAENGNSVLEIYKQKDSLKDQTVLVRGKVVKYTKDVLHRDWIHIRDNSTNNNLAVTTKDKVDLGDIVLIEGKLNLNSDFGYGYVYDVIVEDAKVAVEK